MQTLEEIARRVARPVRGCTTDEQYVGLQADILAALRAERERCAKVADEKRAHYGDLVDQGQGEHGTPGYVRDATWAAWLGHFAEAADIAAAIRNQP